MEKMRMKPMIDPDLLEECRKAIGVKPPPRVIAPRLTIGDQVTFADRKLPGPWVYTGDSFVRPEVWNAPAPVIDYGIRPFR
jgi:hypothetical protein